MDLVGVLVLGLPLMGRALSRLGNRIPSACNHSFAFLLVEGKILLNVVCFALANNDQNDHFAKHHGLVVFIGHGLNHSVNSLTKQTIRDTSLKPADL